MSATLRTVAAYGAELRAVRPTALDDDERRAELAARTSLGFLSEPGDGTLGRLVDALGAAATLDLLVAGAGIAVIARALEAAGALDAAAALDAGEARATRSIEEGLKRWRPRLDESAFARSLAQAARVDARLLVPGDPEWPVGVDDLGAHAPLTLWARGRADALAGGQPAIALVGARAASGYGEHVTADASAGLVDRGFVIASGGAYGIDGTAHRAALASEGTTVAFLAGGIDRFYPTGNDALLTRIAQTGAVFAEVPCGTAPSKWRFLQRNRLIAAASEATVVIEAGLRSGALNTATHAAELGRPLGAVPGPVTSPSSAGCHRLFRERDASCVVDAAQMAELASGMGFGLGARAGTGTASGDAAAGRSLRGSSSGRASGHAPGPELSSEAVRLLDALSSRSARSVDELARSSGLSAGAVRSTLAELDVDELVVRDLEGNWKRRTRRRRPAQG